MPGGVPQPRLQQFVGHAIETRLPPDLCLLGCIFVIADYQDSEEARHLTDWRRVITQYGGEIEEVGPKNKGPLYIECLFGTFLPKLQTICLYQPWQPTHWFVARVTSLELRVSGPIPRLHLLPSGGLALFSTMPYTELSQGLGARVTHVLAKDQKSTIAQEARLQGKRLVSAFWLNDTVVRKKVLPPWKAIHFPLPATFEPPCANMILTLTGFEDRDRDYVKEMIKIAGATYTGYFTRHNHAIICRKPHGEKFDKAREWRVPAVSIQWLNDVIFGSMNAAQSMNNPRYQQFKPEEPLRIDYVLVQHLIQAWKVPIRVTPETYQKFKANPPARIKRKAEKQRQEREAEERRRTLNEERAAQGLPPLDTLPVPEPLAELPVEKEKMEVEESVMNGPKEEEAVVKENDIKMEVEEGGEGAEVEKKPVVLLSGAESEQRK
jgi:hypothetical protein